MQGVTPSCGQPHVGRSTLRGVPGRPYNVGSEEALTIGDLARRVATLEGVDWIIEREPVAGAPAMRYVPSTARARSELGLDCTVGFDDAIARTVRWHRQRQQSLVDRPSPSLVP